MVAFVFLGDGYASIFPARWTYPKLGVRGARSSGGGGSLSVFFALADSLYVVKLIGLGCTAFGSVAPHFFANKKTERKESIN